MPMPENHIIPVAYAADCYTRTRPAYQYDYGQVLKLQDFPELPIGFEMHFSIGNGEAIARIGENGEVAIPNVCLERFGTLAAWLVLHDDVTDGETRYTIEIPVRGRAKATDQEPTPEEQSEITEAIAALQAGVRAAEAAQTAAETAQEKAEDAEDGAKDALDAVIDVAADAIADMAGYVNTASARARDAANSATAAQEAARSVMNASAEATTLEPGSAATADVQNRDGVITFLLGIPEGDPGDPTELIDDTAGDGDTDKAWSADKLVDEFGGKANKTNPEFTGSISLGREAETNKGSGSSAVGFNVRATATASHAEGFDTEATAQGAHSEGNSTKATAQNAHSEGSMTVASGSHCHAEGSGTEASGSYSHSEGSNSVASGTASHSEGYSTASGNNSHSEGYGTTASGYAGHSEGSSTTASGQSSHSGGQNTIANGYTMTAIGRYNVADTALSDWLGGTSYAVGDKVVRNNVGYVCKTANSDASFTSSKWTQIPFNTEEKTLFAIGNGTANNKRSNALRVDANGNQELAGKLTVGAAPTNDMDVATKKYVDDNYVQKTDYASASNAGVLKIDNTQQLGLYVNSSTGMGRINPATSAQIKSGTGAYLPVTSGTEHEAAFFGLAKAAGDDTQAVSSNPVGTYTDDAKTAIKTMLGVSGGGGGAEIDDTAGAGDVTKAWSADKLTTEFGNVNGALSDVEGMVADAESTTTAASAHAKNTVFILNGKLYMATAAIAVGDTIVTSGTGQNVVEVTLAEAFPHDIQIYGTSILVDGVANIPRMVNAGNVVGVGYVRNGYDGLMVDPNYPGRIMLYPTSNDDIKAGSDAYKAVTVGRQHRGVFYGLATAAGDTTQKSSSNAIGTYTDDAKAAIRAMLGIRDWKTATMDLNDWDSSISSFVFDAGQGNEIAELRFYGQCTTEEFTTYSISAGIGNAAASNYNKIANVNNRQASGKRIAFAGDYFVLDSPARSDARIACGRMVHGVGSNGESGLNVDAAATNEATPYSTNYYWNYNDARYFKVTVPNRTPTWAYIFFQYKLK